jgi:hypothetical protein
MICTHCTEVTFDSIIRATASLESIISGFHGPTSHELVSSRAGSELLRHTIVSSVHPSSFLWILVACRAPMGPGRCNSVNLQFECFTRPVIRHVNGFSPYSRTFRVISRAGSLMTRLLRDEHINSGGVPSWLRTTPMGTLLMARFLPHSQPGFVLRPISHFPIVCSQRIALSNLKCILRLHRLPM